jgi:anti-sigma regulatory factor (Ser/Thr protein kinase)
MGAAALAVSWPVRCAPAALEPLRRDLGRWLAAAGWPADEAADLVLAVSEAVSNAVEHGCARVCEGIRVDARLTTAHASCHVDCTVHDCGRWDGVATSAAPRGHGMRLIRALTRELRVEHGDAGTTLHLASYDRPRRTPP